MTKKKRTFFTTTTRNRLSLYSNQTKNNKVRIAINTLGPSKIKAGIGNYVVNLVKELSKLDIKNEYVILANSDNAEFFTTNNPNFKTITLPNYTRTKFLRILWEQFKLPKLLRQMGIDILHSPGFIAPLRMTAKSVVTIHDMTFFSHPQYHTKFKRFYFKKMIPLTAKKAAVIIADSENTKKDICKYLDADKQKIAVIHLGVGKDFKKIDAGKAKKFISRKYGIKNKFILFVGMIEPRKNLQRLVDAFLQLKEHELKLVIVGKKGWQMDEFFKMIKELKLEDSIIFPGYVPDDDLVKFYNAAEVFVYPSMYEGFGIPVLEALACGCPVITSNTSSMPEITGPAAVLINPADTQDIKKAMQKLLKNEQLRKTLSEQGIEQAKKFSWQKTAQKTLEAYEKTYNLKINKIN